MRAAAPGPSLSELLESEKRRVRSPMNPEKLSHEHRKTTIIPECMHSLFHLFTVKSNNHKPCRAAHAAVEADAPPAQPPRQLHRAAHTPAATTHYHVDVPIGTAAYVYHV